MANVIKLSKDFMYDKILYGPKGTIIRDEIVDTGRWSIHHELIFKHDGKLWCTNYSVGATESQDERAWEYETEVECTEVEAYEKTVVDYRSVG